MKELWFDVETTGTDVERHGVIQVAMIAVVDDGVHEASWRVKPFPQDEVDPEALRVNRMSSAMITGYPSPLVAHSKIVSFLGRFVDKFDRADKFTPGGYNADRFDLPFLKRFFEKCGDKYFGSWFDYMTVDPYPVARFMRYVGTLDLPNYKLATVCEAFDVPLGEDAHDAMVDVRATRALARVMRGDMSWRVQR